MNNTKKINIILAVATFVLFLYSCFFMYDFYKCLSGFIANGFRYPMMMLPLVLTYLLPPVCFLFFFYSTFVGRINKITNITRSVLILAVAIFCLVGIFNNFDIFSSNNALGVYQSLPSIFLSFPYDGIVLNILIALLQIYNVFAILFPCEKLKAKQELFVRNGWVKTSVIEYIALSVIAILTFVFVGSALCCFNAIENTLYDAKYIYLVLWILIIPLFNLAMLTYKPEKRNFTQKTKLLFLILSILINVVFALLFVIFELTSPNFIVHVGKPLFMIAFSVSLPIEMAVIFGIMLISVTAYVVKLLIVLRKGKKQL